MEIVIMTENPTFQQLIPGSKMYTIYYNLVPLILFKLS